MYTKSLVTQIHEQEMITPTIIYLTNPSRTITTGRGLITWVIICNNKLSIFLVITLKVTEICILSLLSSVGTNKHTKARQEVTEGVVI